MNRNDFEKKYYAWKNKRLSELAGYSNTEKIKMFLHTLPQGKVFSKQELKEYVEINKLYITAEELIKYGNECNWLTRCGNSFSSIGVFANSYNSVILNS